MDLEAQFLQLSLAIWTRVVPSPLNISSNVSIDVIMFLQGDPGEGRGGLGCLAKRPASHVA